MAYQYNTKNSAGRNNSNWTSTRGTTTQQLQALPPITTAVNGKVRYYSSIDAELYFGDIFIDEVTNIGWSIQQQTLPIYGYNSYTFDDMAVGSRIIQGQFAINFTERNFLINKVQNSSSFQKISRRMYGEDNPATCTVYSDFRQKLHLPVWDKGFDLVVGFGEDPMSGNNSLYGTYLVLNCVQLTGSQIQLDYNGDPIMEVYSFVARDIKETFSDATSANPSTVNNETSVETSADSLQLTGTIDLTASTNQITLTAGSTVTFSSGSVYLTGTYDDSRLNSKFTLSTNKATMTYTLSSDLLTLFKSKFTSSSSPIGIVTCSFKSGTSSASSTATLHNAQVKVTFKVKS